MPKMKTHKGAAKRFRITKRGKMMRMRAGGSHLRRKKRKSVNSDFRHAVPTTQKAQIKQVKAIAGKAVQ
jgi:large subunit ribosomal protein L35